MSVIPILRREYRDRIPGVQWPWGCKMREKILDLHWGSKCALGVRPYPTQPSPGENVKLFERKEAEERTVKGFMLLENNCCGSCTKVRRKLAGAAPFFHLVGLG